MTTNSLRSMTKRLDGLEARSGSARVVVVFDDAEAKAMERADAIPADALIVITGVPRPAAVGA